MSKLMKGFIAAMLAVCVSVCLCLAVACDTEPEKKDEPAKVTSIEVTVQLDDGSPAVGVYVGVCAKDGSKPGCAMPKDTQADGKVTVDVKYYIDNGSKEFEIHLTAIPEGYKYVDKDGKEYDSESGVGLDITKTNTVTIKLAKKAEEAYKYESFEIELADAGATQEVAPSIKKAGYYELRSAENRFTVSGEGFNLTGGYNNVFVYLEVGDVLSVGTAGSLKFNFFVVAATADGDTTPISTLTSNVVVLKLAANDSVKMINPARGQGGVTNSPMIIGGSNFTATLNGKTLSEEFPVAAGKQFTVKATDATKCVILNFSSPASSTAVKVGESTDFEISLINTADNDKETLQWLTSTYYLRFTTSAAGFYKVSVSSEFEKDKLMITQVSGNVGGTTVIPAESESSDAAGKEYYVIYKLKANMSYSASLVSGNDPTSTPSTAPSAGSVYDGMADGDTIKYTATVTKVDPVYKDTLKLGSNKLDADFAYRYKVTTAGNYKIEISNEKIDWSVNGEKVTGKSIIVTMQADEYITLDISANCTVTVSKSE